MTNPPENQPPEGTFARWITQVAAGVVAAQREMDAHHNTAAVARATAAPPEPDPTLGISIQDPQQVWFVSKQVAQISITASRSITRRTAIDLQYGGRVVDTYVESVYGHESTAYDHLSVTIEAVPVSPVST